MLKGKYLSENSAFIDPFVLKCVKNDTDLNIKWYFNNYIFIMRVSLSCQIRVEN